MTDWKTPEFVVNEKLVQRNYARIGIICSHADAAAGTGAEQKKSGCMLIGEDCLTTEICDDSDAAAISPETRPPPDTATCPAASRATPSLSRACKDIRKLRHQKPPPAAQVQLATLRPPPPVVESRNSTTNYTADTLFAWMPMPSSHERLNFDDRFNGAERLCVARVRR
ncbi:Hypothetical predicted protein [Cloeon dipterum]|uniref:Uncharacterized protein n=1 Tax=Cloeon dipterum TaxID=197152 RepID=A0A8S1E0D4_9INSE|nr:Hypothetical predicted protein [Cloeon dipterum]